MERKLFNRLFNKFFDKKNGRTSTLLPSSFFLLPFKRPSSFFLLPSSSARRAFTLVELLVVVAILAILSGVLFATLGGGTASARSARCLSNMKNLANATHSYGLEKEYHPCAGNVVYMQMKELSGNRVKRTYQENPGWISADSKDMFPSASSSTPTPISLYTEDDEAAWYALTNGALWKYVSQNRETYVCPEHARHSIGGSSATKGGSSSGTRKVRWSYLMNAWFGWNKNGRPKADQWSNRKHYGRQTNLDKRLLFSEVPFMGYNNWEPTGGGGSTDTDAILQYGEDGLDSGSKGGNTGGGTEEIGVNHVNGRNAFAHVAFADGHVEKLRVPMSGGKPDTADFKKLTSWLCAGYDVSFDGSKYDRVK